MHQQRFAHTENTIMAYTVYIILKLCCSVLELKLQYIQLVSVQQLLV